ncbi:MAG TPA: phage holin family protein [Oligoflexus sp.]|uniref:phage holin family protein n=1 Tax=Oligoflexus sp. TaxID=1971216 RepID=UPI002D7E93B4|nr:phage holin family protein [Oligoflexus sp.]HET9235829.1 phage holin family protein [Oligoflexus sp.]
MRVSETTMIHSLIIWLLNAAALMVTSHVIKGMQVNGFVSALLAALVLAVANHFLLPILTILTLPLTVVTLGIFWFILYGAMLKISAAVIPGFTINGWLPAIIGSIVLTIIQWVFRAAFETFA